MSDLRRGLGLGSLTFYGVGLILGAGIYSILGQAAGVAGDALWISFLLGSFAALLTGLSYAELATMYPEAGAEYVYVRQAWPGIAWLPGTLGWVLVLAGLATAATVALAFAGYATLFLTFPPWTVAAALLVAAGLVNVVGIREASWANVLFTLIEVAGLMALIVAGWRDPDLADVFRTGPHAGVLAGAGLIFFAYLGFEDIANLAEEARHPAHDLPRAILISVAISTLLYVLVAAVSVALLNPGTLAESSSPLADAMQVAAPRLSGAIGGVALFATANTALITITAASRLLLGMARRGDAPLALGRTLAERKTPAMAILLAALGALAFLPIGNVGIVGSVASMLALVAFATVDLALITLRVRRPEVNRPFRVPFVAGPVPLPTLLGLLAVLMLLTQFDIRAYGAAAAAFVIALGIQALPWSRGAPDRGAGP